MSVIEKIISRTSNPLISDQEIDDRVIKQLLDAAVCTPVHYNSDPWRFLVIKGEQRDRLGEFMAKTAKSKMDDPTEPWNVTKLIKMKGKPLRAPIIIVAGAAMPNTARAMMNENLASVACGCQNILLAAEELGLAAIWRTGSIAYADETVKFLGFEEGTKLVAFIYIGQPVKEMKSRVRKQSDEFTRWSID